MYENILIFIIMFIFKHVIVYTEDLITRPVSELEKIMTFAGIILPDRKKMFKYGWILKSNIKANVKKMNSETDVKWINTAMSVLEDELQSTNTLADWPCKSFRKVTPDESVVTSLPMKANELAPDCTGNYVTCSVPIDKAGG